MIIHLILSQVVDLDLYAQLLYLEVWIIFYLTYELVGF
jgi:hypothetical protein